MALNARLAIPVDCTLVFLCIDAICGCTICQVQYYYCLVDGLYWRENISDLLYWYENTSQHAVFAVPFLVSRPFAMFGLTNYGG